MKIENRIMLNSVYGNLSLNDADAKDALMDSMEKSFRAFSRKNKIKRILSKKAAN